MGRTLRAVSRKNLLAIVAGVFVAGAPLIAFDVWLGGLIERQGQEEVDISARRAVCLAESRVGQVVHSLNDLAAVGVDSCRAEDVTLMRQAAFATAPIKEIALLGRRRQAVVHRSRPAARRTQAVVIRASRWRRRLHARHYPARQRRTHGAAAAQDRHRAERNRSADPGDAVPAAGVGQRWAVRRLCQHGDAGRRHHRRGRRGECIRSLCVPPRLGEIRLQDHDFACRAKR